MHYTSYESLALDVLNRGHRKIDRTGVGTIALAGTQLTYDLAAGFPLITTKFTSFRLVLIELLWLISGDTNIRWLVENKCSIWTDWPWHKYMKETGDKITMAEFEERILADDDFARLWGDLGPVYGKQWRDWEHVDGMVTTHIDQLQNALTMLKTQPDSRRIIVSAWNPGEIGRMALPPCHAFFQFIVIDGKLTCLIVQRSVDIGLGLPFNIASYALLTHIMAQQAGLEVGELVWTGHDTHIYTNQIEGMRELVSRAPYPFPDLEITRKPISLDDYTVGDFTLNNSYQYHPAIKFEVAV